MNRILFVDDEPRVLEGLENMLFEQLDEWDMSFATSASEALAACAKAPFDVVVSDMRMPAMDGAALLAEVRQRWPGTVRIILSGQTDASQTERAVSLAHDILSKPASYDLLVTTIHRALAIQRSCRSDALREVAGHLEGLPARPHAYLRFRRAVDADASIDEIAGLLEGDPALVAGLLRVVRSAYFASIRPIETVRDAVVRLGLSHTASIVLALSAFEELASGSETFAQSVFSHCSTVAQHVRAVAPAAVRNQAFLAALLHDVGHLVTTGYFPDACPVETSDRSYREDEEGCPERERLGFDHGDAGAYLLRLWNLDPAVAEAIEHHHDPLALPPERRAIALHIYAVERALGELGGAQAEPRRVAARARTLLEAGDLR